MRAFWKLRVQDCALAKKGSHPGECGEHLAFTPVTAESHVPCLTRAPKRLCLLDAIVKESLRRRVISFCCIDVLSNEKN